MNKESNNKSPEIIKDVENRKNENVTKVGFNNTPTHTIKKENQ